MTKKSIISILIIVAVLAIIVFLMVTTFVDFRALKKKEFAIKYEASVGGQIEGQTEQTVKEGTNGQTVTAIPNEGYRFLKWSDTCDPNPMRTETEVTGDITAEAIFLKISEIKYEILLIYVTEVQATFRALDGTEVVVDYKMDERDLQLYHMITTQFDIYLNEMFDGLVTFVIDEYYTHEVMREENFYRAATSEFVDVRIYAENIPEVADMLDDYENYITTCYLTDPDMLLNNCAGVAKYKSSNIHLQETIAPSLFKGTEIDRGDALLSSFNSYHFGGTNLHLWDDLMEIYIHEFTHSVELGLTEAQLYEFHNVLVNCSNISTNYVADRSMEITRLYLLNQAEYNGKIVGIPFTVWTKDVYTVNYFVNDNYMGYIEGGLGGLISYGITSWRVAKGCDVGEVIAIPASRCRFVGWSDGVTTPIRTDINIQGDMNITAIFEHI